MPIPHFNTAEFFINDNDNDYREYIRILDELNDEWKRMVNNGLLIEDAQRYQNILSDLYDTIDDNNSINDNNKDELLEYITELHFECEYALEYINYKHKLVELNNIIHNKCDEWKLMVKNHYNNDDIMNNIIEDSQRYQNILSDLYDTIDSNNSIDTNDKDELLEYIAELHFECEESLQYD